MCCIWMMITYLCYKDFSLCMLDFEIHLHVFSGSGDNNSVIHVWDNDMITKQGCFMVCEFFGTHHLSYCSCVILHHIYPIIVYTLILSVVMGRGGGWQARGAVFYEKKLKQINSHIQSNLDIQDYFNGMTRNGVKKIISKIQNNPNIGDKKLESSFRDNLQW